MPRPTSAAARSHAYSAPDGTLYVIDMYRGVVQAGGIWSDYLTGYIQKNKMLLPVGYGRIWRVVYGNGPTARGPKPSLSKATAQQLVDTLSHPNGWWRDTAQQLLIQRGEKSAVPALQTLAAQRDRIARTRLHALWTIEGLDAITPAMVTKALSDSRRTCAPARSRSQNAGCARRVTRSRRRC